MPTITDSPAERASRPLVVRLPQKMHEEVRRQATEEDRTIAQVVRRALRAYLERERAAIG